MKTKKKCTCCVDSKITIGDRVQIVSPISRFANKTGTVVGINNDYFPPITVVLDGDKRVPELAATFWREEDLGKI